MDDPPVWELDRGQKLISLMEPAYMLHGNRVESSELIVRSETRQIQK